MSRQSLSLVGTPTGEINRSTATRSFDLVSLEPESRPSSICCILPSGRRVSSAAADRTSTDTAAPAPRNVRMSAQCSRRRQVDVSDDMPRQSLSATTRRRLLANVSEKQERRRCQPQDPLGVRAFEIADLAVVDKARRWPQCTAMQRQPGAGTRPPSPSQWSLDRQRTEIGAGGEELVRGRWTVRGESAAATRAGRSSPAGRIRRGATWLLRRSPLVKARLRARHDRLKHCSAPDALRE